MELQEILDIVEDRKRLVEMSFPVNQIRSQLMNREFEVNRFYHLILIYYFRDEQAADHWIGELSKFIPESALVKGKNKRLGTKETFHYIWNGYAEDYTIEHIHDGAFSNAKDAEETKRKLEERKTGRKIPPLPWDSIKQNPKDAVLFMTEFHEWVAKKLTEKGEVFTPEIREIILVLLNKHPLNS